MTRHKSRVARRSRRSARRGTRKQSGGMFDWLTKWFKKTDPDAAAGAPTVPDSNKGFFNKAPTDQTQHPAPAATVPPPAAPGQVGGRKTRHRRRSPRHHRK